MRFRLPEKKLSEVLPHFLRYDGGNTASRGDVIVVTVNYRLGALGNMASSSLNGSQGISKSMIEASPVALPAYVL